MRKPRPRGLRSRVVALFFLPDFPAFYNKGAGRTAFCPGRQTGPAGSAGPDSPGRRPRRWPGAGPGGGGRSLPFLSARVLGAANGRSAPVTGALEPVPGAGGAGSGGAGKPFRGGACPLRPVGARSRPGLGGGGDWVRSCWLSSESPRSPSRPGPARTPRGPGSEAATRSERRPPGCRSASPGAAGPERGAAGAGRGREAGEAGRPEVGF